MKIRTTSDRIPTGFLPENEFSKIMLSDEDQNLVGLALVKAWRSIFDQKSGNPIPLEGGRPDRTTRCYDIFSHKRILL